MGYLMTLVPGMDDPDVVLSPCAVFSCGCSVDYGNIRVILVLTPIAPTSIVEVSPGKKGQKGRGECSHSSCMQATKALGMAAC
jgi:hypothetical protein